MIQQGGSGLRGPSTATAGSTVDVHVAPGDRSAEVHTGDNNPVTVPADGKTARVPIPLVAPGTIVSVIVGKGPRARVLFIEVVSSIP
jgi:hypothetical protein